MVGAETGTAQANVVTTEGASSSAPSAAPDLDRLGYSISPDGVRIWDGTAWRLRSPDGRDFWDGVKWITAGHLGELHSRPDEPATPTLGKRSRWDMFFAIASVVLGILLGAIVASAWPGNAARVPSPVPSDHAAAYLAVRDANFQPLLQALNGIGGDCATGDRGRCSLSLAYTLALVQKFEAELRPISVPACMAASDVELRQELHRLDDGLHQAIQARAFPADLPGLANLQASQALLEQATCPTS